MASPNDTDAQLRAALKLAAFRTATIRRRLENDQGLLVPRAQPSPEHYHLIYSVPKENVSIPDYRRIFLSSRDAYQQIYDTAIQAEPNVEWGDDGKVGFETRLHGRADLWWVVLEVAACVRSGCTRELERQNLKRRMILLPGESDDR